MNLSETLNRLIKENWKFELYYITEKQKCKLNNGSDRRDSAFYYVADIVQVKRVKAIQPVGQHYLHTSLC